MSSVPVSIFIMDVTDSSRFEKPDVLTKYLGDVVEWIRSWTDGIVEAEVTHRMGDEILVVAEHYVSAFIVASYIRRFWRFAGHEPYFGLSFGRIDRRVSEIQDLEQWNHGLIKLARTASDDLKQQNPRPWMKIDSGFDYESTRELMNVALETYNLLISLQTEMQRDVCSLYVLYQRQATVAEILGKTPATISSHIKSGRCGMILKNNIAIEKTLDRLEDSEKAPHSGIQLKDSIRTYIQKNLNEFLNFTPARQPEQEE